MADFRLESLNLIFQSADYNFAYCPSTKVFRLVNEQHDLANWQHKLANEALRLVNEEHDLANWQHKLANEALHLVNEQYNLSISNPNS